MCKCVVSGDRLLFDSMIQSSEIAKFQLMNGLACSLQSNVDIVIHLYFLLGRLSCSIKRKSRDYLSELSEVVMESYIRY